MLEIVKLAKDSVGLWSQKKIPAQMEETNILTMDCLALNCTVHTQSQRVIMRAFETTFDFLGVLLGYTHTEVERCEVAIVILLHYSEKCAAMRDIALTLRVNYYKSECLLLCVYYSVLLNICPVISC